MRIFILLLSCCFFIFQHFSYSYANTGEIDLHTQMNAVGDALNHQDFTAATVLKDEILKQISVERHLVRGAQTRKINLVSLCRPIKSLPPLHTWERKENIESGGARLPAVQVIPAVG